MPSELVQAAMKFDEEWFDQASQDALVDLAGKVAHLDGEIVEVGSWQGRSTVALANGVHPHPVHAVDTWTGSPGEASQYIAGRRDIYSEFLANVAEGTKGNVIVERMGWRDYFATHAEPIKFLFIDGPHTFEEVRDNLIAAVAVIVPGAIICGDDSHHPPIQKAVLEILGDAQLVATLWWFQTKHSSTTVRKR
jgi:hypothetical protein